ncbi:hypothetical protein GCM10009101_20320 [Brevundimonas lenta]
MTVQDQHVVGSGDRRSKRVLAGVEAVDALEAGLQQTPGYVFGQGGIVFEKQGYAPGEHIPKLGEWIDTDTRHFPTHVRLPSQDDTALKRNNNSPPPSSLP